MELSKFITKHFLNKETVEVDSKYTLENINRDIDKKSLNVGDIFFGSITTTIKDPVTGKKKRLNKAIGIYQVTDTYNKIEVKDCFGQLYKTSVSATDVFKHEYCQAKGILNKLAYYKKELKETEDSKYRAEVKVLAFNFSSLQPEEKLSRTIDAGIKNIWMVGPAGCGKSTMARNVAQNKEIPYLCISCGIGTSATEFIGYKYPTREATSFAEYYSKPSIILIDEMTALDPAVAQILNAALANDEIETTTGLVHRHQECIIIATSNTFGTGADRQYVANNQLDASTIDRFVGGIVEVDYSEKFESQYDDEVVAYINMLRQVVKKNSLRRVISTRMVQAGHNLKFNYYLDWKERLVVNWSDTEKQLIAEFLKTNPVLKPVASTKTSAQDMQERLAKRYIELKKAKAA